MYRIILDGFFLTVLFEGAFRKFIAPGLAVEIQIFRDVLPTLALLAYLMARSKPVFVWPPFLMTASLSLYLMIGLLQSQNSNIWTPLVAILGLRTHFAYLPLLLLAPIYFRNGRELISRLAALCAIAVPIVALGLLQSTLPASHPVNAGVDPTGFGHGTLLRATGTFSYITGFSVFAQFVAVAGVALVAVRPLASRAGAIGLVGMCVGLAGCLASGSRAAVFGAAIQTAVFLLAMALSPHAHRIGAAALRLVLAIGAPIAIALIAIPSITDAFVARTELALQDVNWRMSDAFFEWFEVLERSPLGNGIGMAHQQAGVLAGRGQGFLAGLELELSRIAFELGIFGFAAFMLYRVSSLGGLLVALQRVRQLDVAAGAALAFSTISMSMIGGVYTPITNALVFLCAGVGTWALASAPRIRRMNGHFGQSKRTVGRGPTR